MRGCRPPIFCRRSAGQRPLSIYLQVFNVVAPTFGISDLDERIATRKELIAPGGGLYNKMQIIEKLLSKSTSKYYLGDEPSLADATVYAQACAFNSGCASAPLWKKENHFGLCALLQQAAGIPCPTRGAHRVNF